MANLSNIYIYIYIYIFHLYTQVHVYVLKEKYLGVPVMKGKCWKLCGCAVIFSQELPGPKKYVFLQLPDCPS